ncbi:uncharacterized protein LOC113231779 [Hyposmocoma kahamanoa]|uniref:uncharacterized protein LOC113231779 n=1 Tax=Hyposmocoma kahamanoa TaxID=1477025 RepID=UPI000E6D9BB4|nr:uncharacterized protein LOC113231779 [Hyposmocoma kahamanoa]
MTYWITLCCLLVLVLAKPKDYDDFCEGMHCTGIGSECIDGLCHCSSGYILNHFQNRCVRCPGKGEQCFGACCNYYENGTLSCWQGICQACHDKRGKFICRDNIDQIFYVSSTQIAMVTALVLGIIATLVLLYKLCAATSLRPMGSSSNYEGRLSIGSLQLYIDERLRDAPPRYSIRTAPPNANATVTSATVRFIYDCNIPPPPYTAPKEEENQKVETNQQATIHI